MTPRWPYELVMIEARMKGHDPDPNSDTWQECGKKNELCAVMCWRCERTICPVCEPGMNCRIAWDNVCEG